MRRSHIGLSKTIVRYWNVLIGALCGSLEPLSLPDSVAAKAFGNETRQTLSFSNTIDGLSPWHASLAISNIMSKPDSQTFCVLAKALKQGPSCAKVAKELFQNASTHGIPFDGRFVNAATLREPFRFGKKAYDLHVYNTRRAPAGDPCHLLGSRGKILLQHTMDCCMSAAAHNVPKLPSG